MDSHAKEPGELVQFRDAWAGLAAFPFGNRALIDADPGGELHLRPSLPGPELLDGCGHALAFTGSLPL